MSALLTLTSVAIATPSGHPLLSDLSLAVGRERIGVVGRNGSGKTSLLRVMLGDQMPRSGQVVRSGSIAMLHQIPATAGDVATALGVDLGLACLQRIEAGTGDEGDLAQADWTLPARVAGALDQAGLHDLEPLRAVDSLSGGEQTRLAIARLLLDPPDLLLLDEPTNHLDQAGRAAIARLLADWRGGAVVVSHDRALLEGMDRIVALAATGVAVHAGGWSSWVAARDAARARAAADLDRADRAVRTAAHEAQAARERQARRDRAGRAYAASGSAPPILMGRQRERAENSRGRGQRQAGNEARAADQAREAARARVEVIAPLSIDVPSSGLPANRLVLAFEDVGWCYGDLAVIAGLSFALRGPERVALTGPNGAGKSTVLRLAAGRLAPTSGNLSRPEVPHAIMDQWVALLEPGASLLATIRRLNPALTDNAARAALARFAFRNTMADRLVDNLSGGERLRAGLACVLSAQPVPQLLLLDEPTNHLDLESIEVIEAALRGYDGALLVVSHDRAFLEAIGVEREIALSARSSAAHPPRRR